jgi:hypothetical protein
MADNIIASEVHNAQGLIIKYFTVQAAKVATRGQAATFSGAGIVEDAEAVTEDGIGIFLQSAVAGAKVPVALWGNGICKALVGTNGATRGAPAVWESDGLTDATQGGGTVKQFLAGQFLESGTVGELVALNMAMAGWGVSA